MASVKQLTKLVPLNRLRKAIQTVFTDYEGLPKPPSDFRITAVQDTGRDRYLLMHDDDKQTNQSHSTLIDLEIRDGKIWILQNNTDWEIGEDLVDVGVPRDAIIIEWLTEEEREFSRFGIK